MPQDFPRVPLHPQGFDANRPYDPSTFAAYPAAHHGSQPQGPVHSYSTQMTPLNYGSHTRSAYDGQAAYLDYSAPPQPPSTFNVQSYSPTRGPPGTQLRVSIRTSWDIMVNSNPPSLSYQFGGGRSRKIPTTMTRESSQDNRQYHYLLSSQVPQLPDITEWASEVPIMLVVDSPTGEEFETLVGNFSYESEYGTREPLQQEDIRQNMRVPNLEMRNEVADYQPYQQPSYNSYRPQYSMVAPYESLPAQSHMNQQLSAPPLQQQHSQSPMSWASQNRNNSLSARQLPTISTSNPKLVRISTLDAFRSPLGNSGGSGGYYHQTLKPPPVHLRFEADLERVGRADTWSEDELRLSRRVVHFSRRQNGAEIYLKFWVAKRDELGGGGGANNRQAGTIPVSCILWPRKNQCFVTSVDTIALLQFIMHQPFPTEEKNRIRRNLEHFKPVTVKKPIPGGGPGSGGSEDTNELFTTIMGFGAPKPRNIEKDIKVFRWKDLTKALLKITSKYSIKPSNPLPPSLPPPQQPTPASSTGGSSGYSMDNTGLYVASNDRGSNMPFSPRASTGRSISGQSMHGYAPASFAGASGQNQRLSPPYGRNSIRGINDMHHPASLNQMPSYEHPAQNWPTTPSHHMPMPTPHAPSQYGTPRPSWDLGMPGALAAFPENTGGAATAADMQQQQHAQAPSPRPPLPGDNSLLHQQHHGESRGSVGQATGGLLRHHVGAS